ncbi:uncharacterized protein NPIL_505981 [Nephila pilipes]|uniref:IRF tryptophan pentad repeat domain-containing protein n=1 Tax=Nephila pilipes TaxID=299642 RepID=A0A8X6UJE8_NEPPI|nr:uncharacterized protein NPIL_505981 [Nephila pilipes]
MLFVGRLTFASSSSSVLDGFSEVNHAKFAFYFAKCQFSHLRRLRVSAEIVFLLAGIKGISITLIVSPLRYKLGGKMGRKGSRLMPFFDDGLLFNKYRNLKYEDISKGIFSIYFPHKTNRLASEDELLFKDWYALKGKKYVHLKNYTEAKQAITASLRKSDYVEKVHISDNKLIYRKLTENEVADKKKVKEMFRKLKKELQDDDDLPSVDSAYSSGVDSPTGCLNNESSEDELVQAIEHDHAFGFALETKSPFGGNAFSNNSITNEYMDVGNDTVVKSQNNDFVDVKADSSSNVMYSTSVPKEILNEQDFQKLGEIPMESFNLPLLDDILPMDFDLAELFGNNKSELTPSDTDVQNFDGTIAGKKNYHCKKFAYLGKILILFCEAQQIGMYAAINDDETQIFFDEAVLQEMQGCKSVKECKFINDDILVILEPKDE